MAHPLSVAGYKPLSEIVCDKIRQAILTGHLKPGEHLRQEELATQLGVSRMPVREALHRLVKEGLVEWTPHRGAVVKRLAPRELEATYEALLIIQRTALELAVKRLTDADIDALVEIQEGFRREAFSAEPDYTVLVDFNRRFHRTLYAVCGLPKLARFVESLWDCHPQAMLTVSEQRGAETVAEHDEIVAAARERDLPRLLKASATHLTRAYEGLIRAFQAQEG